MEQWQIVFAEEAAKAEYDEKTRNTARADGQPPQGAGIQHERTMLGPGP